MPINLLCKIPPKFLSNIPGYIINRLRSTGTDLYTAFSPGIFYQVKIVIIKTKVNPVIMRPTAKFSVLTNRIILNLSFLLIKLKSKPLMKIGKILGT